MSRPRPLPRRARVGQDQPRQQSAPRRTRRHDRPRFLDRHHQPAAPRLRDQAVLHGFSAFVEMENVSQRPTAGNVLRSGRPATARRSRTVIADPPGHRGQPSVRPIQDGLDRRLRHLSLDIQAGRQRIVLDDARFIGNVGWRQFEQTYDAASLRTNARYRYRHRLLRLRMGRPAHLRPRRSRTPTPTRTCVHVAYDASRPSSPGHVRSSYLLDFEERRSPQNSSDTLRRPPHRRPLARRRDSDADTLRRLRTDLRPPDRRRRQPHRVRRRLPCRPASASARESLGHLVAGYQLLGSDDGRTSPSASPSERTISSKGFADNFLVTPNAGLQDLYIGVGADLLWGVRGAITYHEFWTDQGGDDLGEEIDLVATKQITPTWSILVKAAFYDGDNGQPDTTRFWAQTTFKF
jgi:hypothetical protein